MSQRLFAAWDRFWFTPQASSSFVLFRGAVGVLVVVWAVLLLPDAGTFFGADGITAGSDAAPAVVVLVAAAGALLASGRATRAAAARVFFGSVWLHRVDPLEWNTGDVLLRHLALFLALAPAPPRRADGAAAFPVHLPWALRLVQVQVIVMYTVSVVEKLRGAAWRDGSAVSYALRIPSDIRVALPDAVLSSPAWSRALTWGTLAVEAAVPLLVWIRRTRGPVLLAGVLLHAAIAVTLRVGLFSWTVLVAYLAFVPPGRAEAVLRRFRPARFSCAR